MAKLKIDLNNPTVVKNLLQEAYMLADEQIVQAQNEINKLSSATKLNEEIMDSKAKYAKSINDYLAIKDKAISKKIEIAKLLSEILQHNGNVGELGSDVSSTGKFDFSKIKEMVKSMHEDGKKEEAKTVDLNFK